jgi:hypothetical protein
VLEEYFVERWSFVWGIIFFTEKRILHSVYVYKTIVVFV